MGRSKINNDYSDGLIIPLFVAGVTLLLGSFYFIARFGFANNSLLEVMNIIGVSFFLIFFPYCAIFFKTRFKIKEAWHNSIPFYFLLGFFLIIVLGNVSSYINISYFFSILGFMFFISAFVIYLKSKNNKIVLVIIFTFLFSLWLVGAIWGTKYINPLFLEKILLGEAHIDTLFHSSMANMIRSYNIPSTGLDGVSFIPYHWGSHFVFVEFAKFLNLSIFDFYNLGRPIIFTALLVQSFLILVFSIRNHFGLNQKNELAFWVIFLISFTGLGTIQLMKKMSITTISLLVSESYSVAMILAFLLLATIFYFLSDKGKEGKSKGETIFLIIFLPLMLGIIGLMKISILILLIITFAYFFIRLRLFKIKTVTLSLIMCGLVTLIVLFLINGENNEIIFFPFHYIREWVDPDLRMFFIITYFFWFWFYLVVRLRQLKITTINELKEAFKGKKLLDIEFIFLISFFGAIPGMIFDIQGGSAGYFSNVHRWFAVSFVLATIPYWLSALRRQRSKVKNLKLTFVVIFLLSVFALYSFFLNTRGLFFYGFVRDNISTRNRLMSSSSEVLKKGHLGYIRDLISDKGFTLRQAVEESFSESQKNLEQNKKYKMLTFLLEQAQTKDKKNTAIFIPQENYLYWNLLRFQDVHFISPALTGMAMIGGLQPFSPSELDEDDLKSLSSFFDKDQLENIKKFYIKTNDKSQKGKVSIKYFLKPNLATEEKIELYNLVSPFYYRYLINYSYWSYDFLSESEYLDRYSTDEKICQQARNKNFAKVLIIETDKDSNPQKRELNCF